MVDQLSEEVVGVSVEVHGGIVEVEEDLGLDVYVRSVLCLSMVGLWADCGRALFWCYLLPFVWVMYGDGPSAGVQWRVVCHWWSGLWLGVGAKIGLSVDFICIVLLC